MNLLKRTIELRVETEEQAKEAIEVYKAEAENKGYMITAAGYTYKTKKAKGEIIDDGFLIKIIETHSGFWDGL